MINVVVDYRNLKFFVYEEDRLTMNNLLPVEVHRAVILQVVQDYAEMISRVLKEQLATDPDVLRQSLVH